MKGLPLKKVLFEHDVHALFDVSLWIKGLDAAIETLAGIVAFFISSQFLASAVQWVFKSEFAEDPRDAIANYFLHAAQNLSVGTQHFAAIYLIAHGVVKLWLVTGLLRERLWYYPVALAVFSGFVAYQIYRYSYSHSAFLLGITVLDLVIIVLTWHEYNYLKKLQKSINL